MKFIRFLYIFLLLAIPQTLLHADVVFLRNGARIEGKIVAQSRTIVKIETATGIQNLPRATVRRIVYGVFDPAAARRRAEEQRKQRLALIKKQQEALRKRQEEATRKQLDELQQAEEEKREAARRLLEQAEAERQQPEPDPIEYGGGPRWLDFLVPGMGQYRAGRSMSGSALAGGALFALAGAGAFEVQRAGFAGAYSQTEELLNLLLLSNDDVSGGGLDLLLSLQRDAIGTRHNQSAAAGQGALGLLAGVYLFNALDLTLLRPGDDAALRFRFDHERAGLAYEIRF